MDDNLFDNLYEKSTQFFKFEKLVNTFVKELTDAVTSQTCLHFCNETMTSPSGKIKIRKEHIKQTIQSQEYFKIYGYMIVKEIQHLIDDFADTDKPRGKELKYQKKEYSEHDESLIEQEIKSNLDKFSVSTQEDQDALRYLIKAEMAEKEYAPEYQKTMHNELKKLALKHFPEITEISGNGLRQIDYMLHDYTDKIGKSMRLVFKSIWKIINTPH